MMGITVHGEVRYFKKFTRNLRIPRIFKGITAQFGLGQKLWGRTCFSSACGNKNKHFPYTKIRTIQAGLFFKLCKPWT